MEHMLRGAYASLSGWLRTEAEEMCMIPGLSHLSLLALVFPYCVHRLDSLIPLLWVAALPCFCWPDVLLGQCGPVVSGLMGKSRGRKGIPQILRFF